VTVLTYILCMRTKHSRITSEIFILVFNAEERRAGGEGHCGDELYASGGGKGQ
jgi:hypothetical protein